MLLYIHIPFCDSKCHYCSFNSYVDKFSLRENYMHALNMQLAYALEQLPAQTRIETVFIGGGTPSTVAPEQYAALFAQFLPRCTPDAEITSEANPNSATTEWLSGMKALGVNRISFGVQSFHADKLKRLGRAHSPMQAVDAVHAAAACGFDHLSVDLIYGVDGDTETLLDHDLATAFTLPIDHLSAYALTIEEGTPFQQTPEIAYERLSLTRRLFDAITARGFEQYEISNFGRHRSRHNLGYWQYEPYIGLGSGAVGFDGVQRTYPHRDVEAYIADPLFCREERLDAAAVQTEKLLLGLRSVVGIDSILLGPQARERAKWLCEAGKLLEKQERFYNPDYLLSDEIALYIDG